MQQMIRPMFLELQAQKTGKIQDTAQAASSFKNQIRVYSFKLKSKIGSSNQQGFASSAPRPEGLELVLFGGMHVPEIWQAHVNGEEITTSQLSVTANDGKGANKADYVINVTGGVISEVDFFAIPADDESTSAAGNQALIKVVISYKKISIDHKVGGKQTEYSFDSAY